jgi:hypothetical protein
MQRLIATLVALVFLGGGAVFAQSGTTTQSGKKPKLIQGVPEAPVGHRQPTKADVSPNSKDSKDAFGADAEDKALDRKIKSICRGC